MDFEREEKVHSEDIQNLKKYIKILNRKMKGIQNNVEELQSENQMLKQKVEFLTGRVNQL